MTGKTHLGSGILVSLLLCNSFISGIYLTFGSILPDIDHHNSFLGKNIPFVSKIFKHRGFTHSLLFAIIIWLFNQWIAYGILVHIFLDLMTHNGIVLFYPSNNRIRFPLAKYVITNGLFEKIIFFIIYLLIIFIIINTFIYKII